MTPDERLRLEERALAKREGDAAGWSRLSREHERHGRRDDAARAALRAHRAAPDDRDLLERLEALDVIEGPWPCERGDAQNRQASPLEGPDEGVLRWRLSLGRPVLRPLVDLFGRIVLRAQPDGLYRVDADGRHADRLGTWGSPVSPVLLAGEPVALDPVTLRRQGAGANVALRRRRLVHGAGGATFGLLEDGLVSLSRDGDSLWRVPMRSQVLDLAVARDGRVLAVNGTSQWLRHAVHDAASGALAWEGPRRPLDANDAFGVWVTAADDGAWVCLVGSTVVCLEAGGDERWRRKLHGLVAAPATVGARLVLTTGSSVEELDLASGRPRWQRELRVADSPTIDGRGIAYVATYDGRVMGLRDDGSTHCQAIVRGTGAPSAVSIGWDRTAFVTVGRELVAIR